ncbi:MAG: hypothetical protein ACJA2S_002720 [Cyclobacteriaceae bacterium]|jgi:hypothetical protein
MKEIKSLPKEELVEMCINKKSSGASFLDIANIFKTNETDDDTRMFVMSKLEDLSCIIHTFRLMWILGVKN